MKKTIQLLMTAITTMASIQPAVAQQDESGSLLKNIPKTGILSRDSENEASERDPAWKAPVSEKPKYIVKQTSSSSTKLADLPQAQQIIDKIAKALTKTAMTVSILSQHKYMINQCLGIKASVGEFKIQLGNPVARLEPGGIFLQFTIDHVTITGLTIRARPCPKDLQCHFGGRFDVSGSASNVRLEITMNPLVDLLNCQVFSGAFSPRIKWRIGGLNLKPLQNNLDEVAKNLIEDALTASAIVLMPNQLMDATISALFDSNLCSGAPQENDANNNGNNDDQNDNPGSSEGQLKNMDERISVLERKVKDLENKFSSDNSSTLSKPRNENAGTESNQWSITPSGTKSTAGLVSIALPPGAQWYLFFQTTAGKDLVRLDNTKSHTLVPGEYNVIVSSIPVLQVPVIKGMNTRVKAGILHVVSAGQWGVYDEAQKINYVTHGSPMKLGLPVGKYNIYLNGQYLPVEI